MAHNPHPHGETVVHTHQLKDHLFPKSKHPAALPDSKRETHQKEEMYDNPSHAEPTGGHNPYSGGGGEPEE